jgi:hypothetical protein
MVQIATRDEEEDLPPVRVYSLEVSCQRPGSLRIQLRFTSQNSSLETLFKGSLNEDYIIEASCPFSDHHDPFLGCNIPFTDSASKLTIHFWLCTSEVYSGTIAPYFRSLQWIFCSLFQRFTVEPLLPISEVHSATFAPYSQADSAKFVPYFKVCSATFAPYSEVYCATFVPCSEVYNAIFAPYFRFQRFFVEPLLPI